MQTKTTDKSEIRKQIVAMRQVELVDLLIKLDPHYQRSDDYSYYKEHDAIAQQIAFVQRQIEINSK